MNTERDYLRTHVFPEIEEWLRASRVHLEWVDLRLGVAVASQRTEEMRELQMLKVCLAEVRRCRPFLIALVGDRYGTVLPADRIKTAAQEEGFGLEVSGRSVTDLEIDFGVMSEPEQQQRSFFYFRHPLPYRNMPAEVAAIYSDAYGSDLYAADRVKRLQSLKQRIQQTVPARVRHYAVSWDEKQQKVVGLEAFGQMVVQDLSREFAAEATTEPVQITWQQAERSALEDFVEDRSRDFVGRQKVLSYLTDRCSLSDPSSPWGVCVVGEPGSGKSSLFGEFYRQLRGFPALVLAHSASASLRSASVDSMLRRWIEELAIALGIGSALPETADNETVDSTFASLFHRAALSRRVIVLLDSLDQFEATPRGHLLTWLPRLWPENARFFATSLPDRTADALSERPGIELIPLPPLDATEARGIAEGIAARYHRTFEPEVLDALLARTTERGRACGNPLWVVLAMEELNLLDADDFSRALSSYRGTLSDQLRSLMVDTIAQMPPNIPDLYNAMFEKADELFDTRFVSAFLGLLAVGRNGWRQSDLQALMPVLSKEPWDGLRVASLRRFFRGQVRQGGEPGQWRFNHAQVGIAVRRRLAAHGIGEIGLHKAIADHLLSLRAGDPLRRSETMVHLCASEDWTRAANYYGNPSLSGDELEAATRALADSVLMPETPDGMTAAQLLTRMLDARDVEGAIEANLALRFLGLLRNAIDPQAPLEVRSILAEGVNRKLEQLLRLNPGETELRRSLSECHERIGDLQAARGDLAGAGLSYGKSLKLATGLVNEQPGNPIWQRELAAIQFKLGTGWEASDLAQAEGWYRKSLAILCDLAELDPHNADWQQELSWSHDRIGAVQQARGDLDGAEASFRASLAIAERLTTSDSTENDWQNDLSASYGRIGGLLLLRGDLAGADQGFRAALAIDRRLADQNPENALYRHNLSVCLNRIGDVQLAQGSLADAETSYREALAIIERLSYLDPTNTDLQRDVRYTRRKVLRALEGSLKSKLSIAESLASQDSTSSARQRNLSMCHNDLGNMQMEEGDFSGALSSYRESQVILQRLADLDPENIQGQDDLSVAWTRVGDMQMHQGHFGEAEASYLASLGINAHVVDVDPKVALWQEHLSITRFRLGDIYVARNDFASAEASLKASLISAQHFAQLEPRNSRPPHFMILGATTLGDIQLAQGDWQGAEGSYRTALQTAEKLTNQDSSKDFFQREKRHWQVILPLPLRKGDVDGAEAALRAALAAFQCLAIVDPANAYWQHRLVVVHQEMCIVHHARRDQTAMEASFRASLAIAERLARRNPSDSWPKRDIAFLNWRMVQVYKLLKRCKDANDHKFAARDALRTIRRLGVEMDQEAKELLDYLEWGGD